MAMIILMDYKIKVNFWLLVRKIKKKVKKAKAKIKRKK